MKLKKILSLAVVAISGFVFTACNSNDNSDKINVEEQSSMLTEALKSKDMARVSALADSMAMYIDELTPDEVVTVLLAYLEVHNSAAQAGDRQKDLETLRKFVDVYDLSMSIDEEKFLSALQQVKKINPNMDVPSIVADFRDKLAEYEALNGVDFDDEPAVPAAKSDSTAKEVVKEDAKVEEVPEVIKPNEGSDDEE